MARYLSNVLQCTFKNSQRSIVSCRAIHMSMTSNNSQQSDTHQKIYVFPLIKYVAAFAKLKKYATTFTAVSVPAASALCYFDWFGLGWLEAVAGLGISSTLTLYISSYCLRNFVGFLSVNDVKNTMMVSYVDFWGKRNDAEIPVKDLIPLQDLPKTLTDNLFVTLRRYSSNDTYKINIVHGKVVDWEKFHHTVGTADIK